MNEMKPPKRQRKQSAKSQMTQGSGPKRQKTSDSRDKKQIATTCLQWYYVATPALLPTYKHTMMVTIVGMTRAWTHRHRLHQDGPEETLHTLRQCMMHGRMTTPVRKVQAKPSSGPSTKYRSWIDLPKGSRFTTEHAKWCLHGAYQYQSTVYTFH